jgi:hypothetical protein
MGDSWAALTGAHRREKPVWCAGDRRTTRGVWGMGVSGVVRDEHLLEVDIQVVVVAIDRQVGVVAAVVLEREAGALIDVRV